MPEYYDSTYRQVVRKLENSSTRPYDEKDENIVDYSCAIFTKINRDGSIDYDLIEEGEFICGKKEQRTEIITIQVDTHKLCNSYYLLQQADRLTYQLCSATLYNC